mgnify:FL=1
MEKTDIHIIGLGNLGSAFLEGLMTSNKEHSIKVYELDTSVLEIYEKKYPENDYFNSFDEFKSGVLILCVKPQSINEIFVQIKDKIHEGVLICSPVAGLDIDHIEKSINNKIIRIMPNLLIRNNKGFIPYSKNYENDYLDFIQSTLNHLGRTKEFSEQYFPVITALSGSGPAWFFLLSNELINAGNKLGLSNQESEILVNEIIKGLPEFISDDVTFSDLISKVKSPKGTTEAGLNSLKNDSFDTIILNAIEKATQRSIELSKELKSE